MIVVDTNVTVYATLPGTERALARQVLARDSEWAAPVLWRSEYRNAVLGLIRSGQVTMAEAFAAMATAAELLQGGEHHPVSEAVLALAEDNRITAYDLEFVAVARELGVPLVTFDRQVLAAFPETAVHPSEFLRRP